MKTKLIKVSYIVEFDDNQNELEVESQIKYKVSQNAEIEDLNSTLQWIETSLIDLDTNQNCGRCFNCGSWTTNREQENPILELHDGAVVDGHLLCDNCLPEEHRWAF